MNEPVQYGLEGDGTLTSIRQFAATHNIDLSKPSDKKTKHCPVKGHRKKKKGKILHGANPLNPNDYKYGYILIFRG